jgi:hypothetical protein
MPVGLLHQIEAGRWQRRAEGVSGSRRARKSGAPDQSSGLADLLRDVRTRCNTGWWPGDTMRLCWRGGLIDGLHALWADQSSVAIKLTLHCRKESAMETLNPFDDEQQSLLIAASMMNCSTACGQKL